MKTFKPIQAELIVTRKEYITPHFIRIYLTGDNIYEFANTTIGVNNKILIPPNDVNKIHFPKLDIENHKIIQAEPNVRPIIRTYTHRGIDLAKNEIWIDFVAHGDEGPASSWAINAQKGNVLGVMMKNEKKELYTKATNYLLVGDATAIPVLSSILEDLDAHEKGICIIEVNSKEDEQQLKTKAEIQFIWLHNHNPQQKSDLAKVVKQQNLPQTDRSAYVAAEFSSVKEIRNYLRKDCNWNREEMYAFSYWKSGVAEDKSKDDRRMERDRDKD